MIGQDFQNKTIDKINKEGISTCGIVYEIGKPARSSNSSIYYYSLYKIKNLRVELMANMGVV